MHRSGATGGIERRGTALGQQEKEIDVWTATPSDLTLAVTQVPPVLTVTQVDSRTAR